MRNSKFAQLIAIAAISVGLVAAPVAASAATPVVTSSSSSAAVQVVETVASPQVSTVSVEKAVVSSPSKAAVSTAKADVSVKSTGLTKQKLMKSFKAVKMGNPKVTKRPLWWCIINGIFAGPVGRLNSGC